MYLFIILIIKIKNSYYFIVGVHVGTFRTKDLL